MELSAIVSKAAMTVPPQSNSQNTTADDATTRVAAIEPIMPSIVRDLKMLVGRGAKFSTIYDPPWPYTNTVARGAAENHYATMSLDRIKNEPVNQLAAAQAHLH